MNMLTKTKSYAHQEKIINESKDCEFAGYFMEQGTGKTHVTIAVATHLFDERRINAVLVLAPNGVHTNWAVNELPTHCATPHRVALWNTSDGKYKRAQFVDTLAEDKTSLLFILANVEAVRTAEFMELMRKHLLQGGDFFNASDKCPFMIVVDESTIIKNPKADVTKGCTLLADHAAYRRILTGTPITQGSLDLFSQCRFLGKSVLPYNSFTAFKYEFAVEEIVNLGPGRPMFKKIVGYRNQDKLAKLISGFSWRVMKKDCLDLPEKVYQKVYVELTPEQKATYRSLVKMSMCELRGSTTTALTAFTVLLRCHQVVLGYITDDNKNMVAVDSNRIKALTDVIENVLPTEKVIIFCRFKEDVRRIMETLGPEQCVQYHGGVHEDARLENVRLFQESPTHRFFVATDAAARGLTLTAATQVIYYSQGFSLEKRLQSEDRAHRIGQKKTVVYTDLVAKGTIDEKVIQALLSKKNIADMVMNVGEVEQFLELE
jgi:SNF2 family DNA or RNA helicase